MSLVQICVKQAITTALKEAETTPIAIGTMVGHTDFATNGVKVGKLLEYDGDEAVMTAIDPTVTFRWKKDGMVDVLRVATLTAEYARRLQTVAEVVSFMEVMGIPAEETLNTLLGADGPTPGCDCEYCTSFTQEDRNALKTEATGGSGNLLNATSAFNDELLRGIGKLDPSKLN
jgi:hypothetical protein